jgi:tetratricopeptide (TPR) repeat protein
MSTYPRFLTLSLFVTLPMFAVTGFAQPATEVVSEPAPASPSNPPATAESKPSNAGQEDLDKAMELKTDADDVEKNGKVIDLIQKAIEKGLPKGDLDLAKEILASAALERAKLLLQDMVKARVGETMARKLQREISRDLELAIKNDPKLGEAHLMLAKFMLTTGSASDKVKGSIESAIENLGHNPEKRGEAYFVRSMLQKDDDAKIADLKRAMKDIPQSVEVQRTLFALLIDRKKYEEVCELGNELLEENSKNPVAIQATIAALLELDRDGEAVRLLDERIDADANDIAMRLMRASVYLKLDKFDEAIEDASKAIEQKPEAIEALLLRCRAYLQRVEAQRLGSDAEDLAKARRDVDNALDLKPTVAEGIRLRALVASGQKRFDEAISDTTVLAKNNPGDPYWLMQLATLYQLNDQPSMATKVADKLISIDDKNWRAYRIRGDAKLSIGDQKEAAEDYKKALANLESKNEDRSGLLNNLAWILATSPEDSLRDGKLSITFGKEACEITEYKEVHILSTLAAGYAESGDFEEAVKWSSRAVELGTKENHEQLEQLENELKSYQEKKPWREKQEVKEIKAPIIRPEETIET